MGSLGSIIELFAEWVPTLTTLLIGVVLVVVVHRLLVKRDDAQSRSPILRQLLVGALAAVVAILTILALPIGDAPRGQLLSLFGLLVTAAIALSSTTLLGNAMAGLMLRSIRAFRPGDFVIVEEHRGRISELGLLRMEIQTERRNLTMLPNLYLVSNPVTVVRSSGTFVAATVSLGYDTPRNQVEKCLIDAANNAGLSDPFVFVLDLGDFSVTYQAAGFLEEPKYLISAESNLRTNMLDALHEAGIEIVSPSFMNQRQLAPDRVFVPKGGRKTAVKQTAVGEPRPEERMFDKAELAEDTADAEQELKSVVAKIARLENELPEGADGETTKAQLRGLEARRAQLEAEIRHHRLRQEEPDAEDG